MTKVKISFSRQNLRCWDENPRVINKYSLNIYPLEYYSTSPYMLLNKSIIISTTILPSHLRIDFVFTKMHMIK